MSGFILKKSKTTLFVSVASLAPLNFEIHSYPHLAQIVPSQACIFAVISDRSPVPLEPDGTSHKWLGQSHHIIGRTRVKPCLKNESCLVGNKTISEFLCRICGAVPTVIEPELIRVLVRWCLMTLKSNLVDPEGLPSEVNARILNWAVRRYVLSIYEVTLRCTTIIGASSDCGRHDVIVVACYLSCFGCRLQCTNSGDGRVMERPLLLISETA